MSYNVLAQSLLERHHYLYRRCNQRSLSWRSRKSRLLDEIKLLNADVLCLQEVEAKQVDNFFRPELEKLGYIGYYKQRTGDKVDGCAICYKADRFELVEARDVEFYKDNIKLLDRDNIGLILRLRAKWSESDEVVVATTHLLYNPRRSDIRLTQTQIMLAEIERAAYQSNGKYCPVIFTGDMNYTPESAVYRLVCEGALQYEGRTDQQTLSRTLLPSSVGVTDLCQYASSLVERNDDGAPQYGSGMLRHGLNLGSAYSHWRCGLPEATTFQDAWHTVDYIFYSQEKVDGRRREGPLKLVSLLRLPNSNEADKLLKGLPSDCCGSDHLPILATFHLTPETS